MSEKYGYLRDGEVVAIQNSASYAATDDSVKSLWRKVPSAVGVGSKLNGTQWVHPVSDGGRFRQKVSPVEFKMMFTSSERIAIRQRRESDEPDLLIDDWFGIIDDPRLEYVDLSLPQTQVGLGYLVQTGIISPERKSEIEAGVPA